jgi:HAD superfamily hydrolase (TIGR01509 family)
MGGQNALANVKGVVFDMDGTLTDSPLDFNVIRAECGVPQGQPILEFLRGAAEPERRRAEAILDRHERRAAEDCTLREGAREVTEELLRRGLKTALLTRNSAESVQTVLRRFGLRFSLWLSREDAEPKPSPQPVLKIARAFGLAPAELLVVGDYIFDVEAGKAAGARTAFVKARNGVPPPAGADVVIVDLRELLEALPPV